MRVGFASDNGTTVNECLLSDTTWWIYDDPLRCPEGFHELLQKTFPAEELRVKRSPKTFKTI
jgi:hypothetical protein